jgi:hypothetical protein
VPGVVRPSSAATAPARPVRAPPPVQACSEAPVAPRGAAAGQVTAPHLARIAVAAVAVAGVGLALTLSPTGSPDATPEPFRALPFTICADLETLDVQPASSPYRRLACAHPCPAGQDCSQASRDLDPGGRPKREVAFTVDGLGGMIRWNSPFPGAPTRAALLTHGGGDGTQFADNDSFGPLQRDGLLVIGVRWHPGIADPLTGATMGWTSKTDMAPEPWSLRTARVAAVIAWAHDQLAPNVPFGLMGTSNGGLATVGAVAWHDLDARVDYHLVSSGNLAWDIAARCQRLVGAWTGPGLCETRPELDCRDHADCPRGGRCAFPELELSHAHRIDYWLTTGDDCARGVPNPAFDTSSLKAPSADLSWDHPVDVIVAEREGGLAEDDDTRNGMVWQNGMFYRGLRTTDPRGKRWVDLDGYGHGHGSGDGDWQAQQHCGIRRGLGLTPLCPNAKGAP